MCIPTAAPHHHGEVLRSIELLFGVNPGVGRGIELVLGFGATVPLHIGKIEIALTGTEILGPNSETRIEAEKRSPIKIAHFGSPVVGDVVDDGEAQRVIEVLIIVLQGPFEGPYLAERRAYGKGAAEVVVVAGLIGERRRRVALSRVGLELWQGQRSG